jgi:hypothetical protein
MSKLIPTRIAAALGTVITTALVLVQETHWSHELKQGVTAVIGLALAWLVHPTETGTAAAPAPAPAILPETARVPDGAATATPPETV